MRARPRRTSPRVEELEPRILFSADAAGLMLAAAPDWNAPPAQVRHVDLPASATARSASEARGGPEDRLSAERALADAMLHALMGEDATRAPDTAERPNEVVFIDGSVAQRDTLLDALGTGVETVVLDPTRDGLAQIADHLEGRQGLGAIHLISEGASGRIQLGDRWLAMASLDEHAHSLARIGAALAPDGDLLLYGCEAGEGSLGTGFIGEVARLTQADVAASSDLTGSARLGGNWTLERHVGQVQTAGILTTESALAFDDVLGTFIVTNTNDSGAGSLRQALEDANDNPGSDSVVFSIGSGHQSIALAGVLPTIVDTVLIDGNSQPGFVSAPLIELNGTAVAGAGLTLAAGASGSTLQGLIINRFGAEGIVLNGVSNVTIAGNHIGTDAAGTTGAGNGSDGIAVWNSSLVTIGGTAAGAGNVIADNGLNGIRLDATSNSTVQGNRIGLTTAGAAAGNAQNGILLETGSTGILIGGPAAGARNVISGNLQHGIQLEGSSNNTIQGNYIGTDVAGTAARGNGADGIYLDNGSNDNVIGGTVAGAGNVISGNAARGLDIWFSTGTVIHGNRIGTNATGNAALGNGGYGLLLVGADNAIVGDGSAGGANTISGNLSDGINIELTSGLSIQGNYIGTNASGAALGNASEGIFLYDGSVDNLIGGTLAGQGNVIAYSTYHGISTGGVNVSGNRFLGNSIHSNVDSGIDLGGTGTTANDPGDADAGWNDLQNFPVITSAVIGVGATLVQGTFNSKASTTYRLEFFANAAPDASGHGEGQLYLGTVDVTTDASGNATFSASVAKSPAGQHWISATATDLAALNTSEFSLAFAGTSALVTASGGTTSYIENGVVAVDPGLTLTDVDNTTLASATVSISGDFAVGQDVLAFANDGSTMGNIGAGYNAATGVLTLSSPGATATIAQWQAALRAVTYANSSDSPSTGGRTVAFVVNDGVGSSGAGNKTLSVTAVNDVPQLTASIGATPYTTNRSVVVVDGSLTLADADHATLSSASVSVTGNFVSGEDTLGFVNDGSTMGNIAASYDAATGVLTLTSTGSTATLAQWQAALRAVTYQDSSSTPTTTTRTVSITVNDGIDNSIAATKSVNVDVSVFIVTNTNDAGAGSLRQAIIASNAHAGTNTIGFSIGSGVQTISPLTALPTITGTVILDATTQSGFTSAPLIELDGTAAPSNAIGLSLESGAVGSSIRGFVINNWSNGIYLNAVSNVTIAGNYIGTDAAGTAAAGNGNGVLIAWRSLNNVIGGTTAADRNVISGNSYGIYMWGDDNHTDLVSGTVISGNYIGTDATGSVPLGNLYDGIFQDSYTYNSLIGGTAPGAGNVIAHNGDGAITLLSSSTTGNSILGNSIHSNTSGIVFYPDNYANDVGDADTGSNRQQNHPVLSGARVGATSTTVSFSFNSAATRSYRVEFFSNAGGGQAQTYLGAVVFVTDASGNHSATLSTLAAAPADQRWITATATDLTTNDTSLISAAVPSSPYVTLSGGSISYTENASPVAIDASLTVSDPYSATLASTTVSISSGLQADADVLSFINNGSTMGNVSASYDAATGVLTLTSAGATATLAQWQSALRAVAYSNSSDAPIATDRTVSVVAYDGTGYGTATTRTVTVTAANDASVVGTTGGATAYTENGTALAVDTGLTVSDADNATLASATVSITGNFAAGQDVLAFANDGTTMGNISASYDATTGVLTLTSAGAAATLAQWQAALRAVTYANSSADPSTANRTVSFIVNDGGTDGAASTKTVSVASVNDAPTVSTSGGATAYTENGTATAIDTGLTISDLDNATLASASVSITGNFAAGQDLLAFANDGSTMGNIGASYNATTGVLTLTSAGATASLAQWQSALRAVAYVNSSDDPSTASRTVSFVVNDGSTDSAASTKTVSVAAVNDAPAVSVSGGTTAYTENGDAAVVDVGLTVSDADHATLASASVSITGNFAAGQDLLAFANDGSTMGNIGASYDAATGVLTLTSAGATATLAQWQAALRSISYANSSDDPSTASRTVSFIVDDGSTANAASSRTVSVAAVNDVPVISPSAGTTAYTENDTAIAVHAGITLGDPDSNTLASSAVRIVGNFASDQDVLAFANDGSTMGDIGASYNAATGVLTLTSAGASATLAQWQAALRAVTYANSSDDPSTASRTVSFIVDDGTGSSASTKTVSVAAVNDTPTVSTIGGATAYTENGSPTLVDTGITLTDADSITLASAAASITGNFAAGQDLLAFVNDGSTMGNIGASYNAATGVLTLTSAGATATLAQWQSALRAVTYANSSDDPSIASRSVSFVLDDGNSDSSASTKVVSVAAVNDEPVVLTSGDTPVYTETIPVDRHLTISDADNATLASATISITANFAAGQDLLAFTNDGITMGNIGASYDAATGVLTLSSAGSAATIAEWQAALRSVLFAHHADVPTTSDAASRTFSISVSDLQGSGQAAARSISIAILQTPTAPHAPSPTTPPTPAGEDPEPARNATSPGPQAPLAIPSTPDTEPSLGGDNEPSHAMDAPIEATPEDTTGRRLQATGITFPAQEPTRNDSAVREAVRFDFAAIDHASLLTSDEGRKTPRLAPQLLWSPSPMASRGVNDAGEQATDNASIERALSLTAILAAGATGLWSLRLSGLLASLAVSRPLWRDLDPLHILPPVDEKEEEEEEANARAPEDSAYDTLAETSANELLDGSRHGALLP